MIKRAYEFLFTLYVLMICFFVGGCSTCSPPKTTLPEKAAEIRIGQSKKQDILNIFGLPHEVVQQEQKNAGQIEYWVYYKGRGEVKTHVIIPIPVASSNNYTLWGGATPKVSSEKAKQIAVTVAFDVNGIVMDVSSDNGGEKHEKKP